jgi:hypothetical protein
MQNFLDVVENEDKCRSLISQIYPAFQWGRMNDRWWTTSGEMDKFCSPTKGCAQRLNSCLKSLLRQDDIAEIRISDEAEYFALQMGKHSGAFAAPMMMWGHIQAVSPRAALIAVVVHQKNDNSDAVRSALGIPSDKALALIKAISKAIESEQPDPSWGYTREIVAVKAPAPIENKSPQVFGELSGLLQVCFAEEKRARDRYESLIASVDAAKMLLDEAIENTKAVVRATEIAEKLKK